ncbi:protein HGH1 homolog [Haemaphysalis longicornis]
MTAEQELVQFLAIEAPTAVKHQALSYVIGLIDTEDGLNLLRRNWDLLKAVALLIHDKNAETTSKALSCLVNFTSKSTICEHLTEHNYGALLENLLEALLSESDSARTLQCAAILSNLTRSMQGAKKIWALMSSTNKADHLLQVLVSSSSEKLDHVSFMFSNLSQLRDVREWFLDKTAKRVQKLFPLLTLETSTVRKHGAVGVLRNCCFETGNNEWLLSAEVDILPRLLYPLVGPEELDEDEMEKLPLDLQYLGSDKRREESPEIRQMLIEAITQLCATKKCRVQVKDSGAYYVLRELHKVEQCRPVVVACENLVDILISDEPEPGMENLKEVDIPEHLVEKFDNYSKELLKLE